MGRIIRSPKVLEKLDLDRETKSVVSNFLEKKLYIPFEHNSGNRREVYVHYVSPELDNLGVKIDSDEINSCGVSKWGDYAIQLGSKMFVMPPILLLGQRGKKDIVRVYSHLRQSPYGSMIFGAWEPARRGGRFKTQEGWRVTEAALDEFDIEFHGFTHYKSNEDGSSLLSLNDNRFGKPVKSGKDLERRVVNFTLALKTIVEYFTERDKEYGEKGKIFAREIKEKYRTHRNL